MIKTSTLITTLGTVIAATMMTITITTGPPPMTDTKPHTIAIIHMSNLPSITTKNTLPTTLDIMTTLIAVLQPLHAANTMMSLVMMLTTPTPRDLDVIKVVD